MDDPVMSVAGVPNRLFSLLCTLLLAVALSLPAIAQNDTSPAKNTQIKSTIDALNSMIGLQTTMRADMDRLHAQLAAAQSPTDKKELQAQLDKMETDLQATTHNLKQIAAGADIDSLRATQEKPFNIQEELFALLRPAFHEIRDMTSHVREKSDLKDRIAYYDTKLPVTEHAVDNITRLLNHTDDKALQQTLQEVLADWKKQLTYIQGERQSAELQLAKLEQSEETLAQASQGYLKSFFQRRGLYLVQALLVVIVILLLSRFAYRAMFRLIPGYRAEHRSFRLRLLDLVHRMLTTVLVIVGPMVVFYVVEDWVLFSLGILLLIGAGLTLRHALPRYWQQIQLFLNVGSVREGERVYLEGLPWLVKQINIFSILENPAAEICQRVRIDNLVDFKSHPFRKEDPWFPCKRGDWVLLGEGICGKVVGITAELVQIIMRGGAVQTFATTDFLAKSPVNLSRNFRLNSTIGISYSLQAGSVNSIPGQLQAHIAQRIEEEGFGPHLLNLKVEFERANTSSLDLMVLADFDGAAADQYAPLKRSLQRWCVEACTKHGWEIPFTQLTLHQAVPAQHGLPG
jgi:hypothetical protein